MNFNNRIDHHLRAIEAKKEAEALKDKIAEISECAVALHDAFFGNEFDRDALLRSEEFLMMFIQYLKGNN
jgi:predicted secreted Zn-dependent protease